MCTIGHIKNDLVFLAVGEAYRQGYTSISLPLMRTGIMKNAVAPVQQVPALMVNGIIRAVDLYERPITSNIVAYHDNQSANAVIAQLSKYV